MSNMEYIENSYDAGFREGEFEGQLMGEQRGYQDGFLGKEESRPPAYYVYVERMHREFMNALDRKREDYLHKKRYYDGYCEGLKHGFTEGFKDGADEYIQSYD